MSDWEYPFSQDDVKEWKDQHGPLNVHLVLVEDEPYVVRGLKRAEFQDLSETEFRNDEHMEDTFVHAALLYPQMNEVDLRNLPGGVSNNLFDSIMEKSNIEAWRDKEILKLDKDSTKMEPQAADLVSAEIDKGDLKDADILGILNNPKNGKNVYVTEFEGKLFIYKGLSRSEFERFRTQQREGKYQGPASEEEICERCILYPSKLDTTGDSLLTGTVSSLSLLIMRVSGFGAAKEVVTL